MTKSVQGDKENVIPKRHAELVSASFKNVSIISVIPNVFWNFLRVLQFRP